MIGLTSGTNHEEDWKYDDLPIAVPDDEQPIGEEGVADESGSHIYRILGNVCVSS